MPWEVNITRMTPHPRGIELRLAIHNKRAGWVKFASTVVVYDDLDDYLRGLIVRRLMAESSMEETDDTLF